MARSLFMAIAAIIALTMIAFAPPRFQGVPQSANFRLFPNFAGAFDKTFKLCNHLR